MTESNWLATCKRCGQFLGVAMLEEKEGRFYVMDSATCTCPWRIRTVEIKPNDEFVEHELRLAKP